MTPRQAAKDRPHTTVARLRLRHRWSSALQLLVRIEYPYRPRIISQALIAHSLALSRETYRAATDAPRPPNGPYPAVNRPLWIEQ